MSFVSGASQPASDTLCNVDKLEIRGNVFNRDGNDSNHVDNAEH